ncbi:MAG: hypothetical protein AAGB93_13405 [Planctomycetota bacterium]
MTDVPIQPQQPPQGDDPYGQTNPVQPVEGLGPDYGMASSDESWLLDGGDLPEPEPLLHQEVQALPDDLAPAPASDPEDGWLLETMDSPAPAESLEQGVEYGTEYAAEDQYVGEDTLPGTSYVEPEPRSRPFTRALMPGAAALLLSFGGIALWSFLRPPEEGAPREIAKVTKETNRSNGGEDVQLADPTGALRGGSTGRLSHQKNGDIVAVGGSAKPPVSTATVAEPREPGELSQGVDPAVAAAEPAVSDADWTDAAGAAPEEWEDDLDAFVEVDVEAEDGFGDLVGAPAEEMLGDDLLAFEDAGADDAPIEDGEVDPLQAALDGMTTDESPELAEVDDPLAETGFGEAIADAARDGDAELEPAPELDVDPGLAEETADVAALGLPVEDEIVFDGPAELPFEEILAATTAADGTDGDAAAIDPSTTDEGGDDWDDWGDEWDDAESVAAADPAESTEVPATDGVTADGNDSDETASVEPAPVEEASPWDLTAVEVADAMEPRPEGTDVASAPRAMEGQAGEAEAHARLDALFGSFDATHEQESVAAVDMAPLETDESVSSPEIEGWDLSADPMPAEGELAADAAPVDPWSQDVASVEVAAPDEAPASDDVALAEADPWVQGVPETSDEFPAPKADAVEEAGDGWDAPVDPSEGPVTDEVAVAPVVGETVGPDPAGPVALEGDPAFDPAAEEVGPALPAVEEPVAAVAAEEPEEVDVEVRSSIAGEAPRKKRSGVLTRVGDDRVWRHKSVPKRKIDSTTMVLTPNVGVVRVVFDGGESIDGRLHAVGQNKVVLDTKMGRMSIDGRRTDRIDRLSTSTRNMQAPSKTGSTAGLQRVRVKAKGGVFYGHLVSQEGDQVTLLLDEGFRLTLTSTDVVPVVGSKSRGSRLRRVEPKTPGR